MCRLQPTTTSPTTLYDVVVLPRQARPRLSSASAPLRFAVAHFALSVNFANIAYSRVSNAPPPSGPRGGNLGALDLARGVDRIAVGGNDGRVTPRSTNRSTQKE